MSKIIRAVDWYVHLAMIVSVGLGIAAFCIPPYAVIDRSILAFIAEITGAAALLTFLVKLPEYIEKGGTARVTKGNTTIEVGGKSYHNRDEIINENDNPEEIEET